MADDNPDVFTWDLLEDASQFEPCDCDDFDSYLTVLNGVATGMGMLTAFYTSLPDILTVEEETDLTYRLRRGLSLDKSVEHALIRPTMIWDLAAHFCSDLRNWNIIRAGRLGVVDDDGRAVAKMAALCRFMSLILFCSQSMSLRLVQALSRTVIEIQVEIDNIMITYFDNPRRQPVLHVEGPQSSSLEIFETPRKKRCLPDVVDVDLDEITSEQEARYRSMIAIIKFSSSVKNAAKSNAIAYVVDQVRIELWESAISNRVKERIEKICKHFEEDVEVVFCQPAQFSAKVRKWKKEGGIVPAGMPDPLPLPHPMANPMAMPSQPSPLLTSPQESFDLELESHQHTSIYSADDNESI